MTGKITPSMADREKRAVELRIAGLSYEAIAKDIGVAGAGPAWRIVQRALKRSVREAADELRDIELRRLDEMWAGVWEQAKAGKLFAIDRALLIMQRRAELLGLDAPKKLAPTNPDGTAEYGGLSDGDIIRELAAMADLARARAISAASGDLALPVGITSAREPDATD